MAKKKKETSPDEEQNKDLTIELLKKVVDNQQKQLDNTQKQLEEFQKQLIDRDTKVMELTKISMGVQEAKRKNELELLQGKYYENQPTTLTWDIITDISKQIMEGLDIEDAVIVLGLSLKDYYIWKDLAREAKTENDIYYQLWNAIKRAKAYFEKRYTNEIDKYLLTPDNKIITENELKALTDKEKIELKLEHRKNQANKAKVAMERLKMARPNKFIPKAGVLGFQQEEEIILNSEIVNESNPKTESVEAYKVASKLQSIIKRKTKSVSFIVQEQDDDD